ncbi:MAG: 3-hydroxybutyryl-CoA dehydrogenase, partial [Burkholderiaceae bacterium]|nr:3-hydroxybutyryl-CoA dehydrogenase [Burkholderiaceae bacterium]
MTIRTVGIIGAGTMGSGIAQACAAAGIDALMQDIDERALERGSKAVAGSLERLVKKGTLDEAGRASILSRVRTSTRLGDLAGAQLVIEAATENEALKARILAEVEAVVDAGAIIATNTSSISITRLAATLKLPERFVGMHFFNP